MPTRIPSRPPFWRRLHVEPDTARNIASTVTECGCAMAFVAMTVLFATHLDLSSVTKAKWLPPLVVNVPIQFGP